MTPKTTKTPPPTKLVALKSAVISKVQQLPTKLLAIAAGLVVVGAGSYYGLVVPNKPENVLKSSLKNSLQKHQINTKGTLNVDDERAKNQTLKAYDVNFESQLDLDKKTAAFIVKPNISGIEFPVELRSLDQSLYLHVGDLSTIKNVIEASGSPYAVLVDKANQSIGNQWLQIDSTILRQAKLECALDLWQPLTKEDINLIFKAYDNNQFGSIKSTANEKIDGHDAIRYELSLDKSKLSGYSQGLKDISLLKRVQECSKSKDSLTDSKQLKKEGETTLTIWVDKKTKLISRLESSSLSQEANSGLKGKLRVDFNYDKPDISKPDNPKPIVQALSELSSVLQGILGGSSTPSKPL